MNLLRKMLMLCFLPLGAGAFFFLGSCQTIFRAPNWDAYDRFEFTVWGDTARDGNLGNIRTVQLSEREMIRASLLVLQNQDTVLPFADLAHRSFFQLTIGEPLPRFSENLRLYTSVGDTTVASVEGLEIGLFTMHSPLIVALNGKPENLYALNQFLEKLQAETEVVLVNFGDHEYLQAVADFSTIVQVPNRQKLSQELAAQLLFGGISTQRSIPEDIATSLKLDRNYSIPQTRLAYGEPEFMGISSDSLAQIDAIVAEAINSYALPGCQVLIAKSNQVIFHKAYGYHTYERKRPVRKDDLYDLASITKVAATTLASMELYEEQALQLSAPLGTYFQDQTFIPQPYQVYDSLPAIRVQDDSLGLSVALVEDSLTQADTFQLVSRWVYPDRVPRHSPVFDIALGDLLTHTSGLQASLPIEPYQYYESRHLYAASYDERYSIPVAEELYLRENYLDSIWNVTKSLRRDTLGYRYSCVNMILMQRAIDSINQSPIDGYLNERFYQPLGLQTMCYNPRELFEEDRLVPTASDRWRGQLLCGTVHDPTAALLGGVSGNAGLFSNANDLAILFQMLLNGGEYGGRRYLADSTVQLFTQRQRGHRGFGFDKPPRNSDYIVARSAPAESYGHTGFTGTCVWVDPEHELVYVFLSNRIHPSVKNYRINELRVRQRIHQVIYESLGVPPRFQEPVRPALPQIAPVFLASTD